MQISRLFEIVYILMNQKTTTAAELSQHFEVSTRTIYRDIESLCQAGIPIYTNKGKGGGITLMDHFVLNKSVLTEQEQNEILSALTGLSAVNYPDVDQILSKLNSLFGSKNYDWIEVDFSDWNSTKNDKDKFQLIKESILNQKLIQFDYYNSYGQKTYRKVEPRRLVFRGQAWYLYGFCKDKSDYRYYKITRIQELKKCEESFPFTPLPPKEAIADTYQRTANLLSVVLRISASMAYRIYDEFPPEAISREANGDFIIQTKLQEGGWLIGYLMSFEDQLEVLEPSELRNNLMQIFENSLKKYL